MNPPPSAPLPDGAAPHPAVQGPEFDELDDILDDLRTRDDETPQWEFCEGFLAALVCCRRAIPQDEYLPVLLGEAGFTDAAQRERFLELWNRRWAEVAAALAQEVQSLDDERAYHPEVMDVRGTLAALSPEERAGFGDEAVPSFAQVWALGFMFAVENWPEEWAPPRDKDAARWLDASLQSLVALTEDDTAPPTLSPFSEDGPASVSEQRLDAFGEALWAVYDLFEIWRSIGPRVETVRKEATPGRNEACWCGSGKKFKKCHGA